MRYYLSVLLMLIALGCVSKKDKNATDESSASSKERVDVSEETVKEGDSDAAYTIRLCDYIKGNGNKKITLNSFINRLEYVPLNTPKELPVDILLSVKVSDENIFVLDRSQRLFRFDKSGRFLNLIGKKGSGPEEYVGAVNFEIDDKKDIVYLLDIHRHKMMQYSTAGKYMGSLAVPEEVVDATLLNDSCFIGYKPWYMSDDNADRLILFDKKAAFQELCTLNRFDRNEEVKIDIFRMAEFYKTGGKNYIRTPFDNTTYTISEHNHVGKEFCIEQGKYALPKNIAVNTELYNKNLSSHYIFELNAKRMGEWVYMSFFYNKDHYRVAYNLRSKSFYTISKGRDLMGIENDVDHGASFWPLWIDSGVVIGSMDVETLEEDFSDELNEKYEKFKQNDNPVLQLGYIN